MKENLVISISSVRGSYHFHISRWYRKCLKGASYFLIFGVFAVVGTMYYLVHEVDFAKVKQKELEDRSMSLSADVESLRTLKNNLQGELIDREEKMQLVTDRLGEVEKVLGVNDGDADIDLRLDTATITSSVRMRLLHVLPNGAPVKNARISSTYGKRVHPVTGKVRFHSGLDFAVNIGTPIYAPADGVVEVTRPSHEGAGNFLRLEHAYGFSSSYSHMSKFKVKMGDFVRKGDLIGYSGNTGLSSGPHLHYEVRFIRRSLNPRPFVDWSVNNFDTIFTKIRGIRWESLVNNVERRVSAQLQLSSLKAVPSVDNSK